MTLYPVNGQMVEGEEIEFQPEHEPFCTLLLADGTRVRVKAVVTKVVRLNAKDSKGNWLYFVESMNVMNTSEPKTLNRGLALPAPHGLPYA